MKRHMDAGEFLCMSGESLVLSICSAVGARAGRDSEIDWIVKAPIHCLNKT